MNHKTITILAIILGVIAVAAVSILATIGLQSSRSPKLEVASTPAVAADVVTLPTVSPPVAPDVPAPVLVPVVTPTTVPAPEVAQIISVKPHMVSSSKPKQTCEQVPKTVMVEQQAKVPAAGAVIGGIAGGLAGSVVHGKGREVAIGAGAAAGALAGNATQKKLNQPVPVTEYVTQCTTHYVSTSHQKGYEVIYSYQGQQTKVIMQNPPVGTTLTLPIVSGQ